MRKIVRVITRLNIGGPAIHVVLLSSEFNLAGYKDILVSGRTSETEGDMDYYAKEKSVSPLYVDELGRDISFWKDIRAFFTILAVMIKEKPDIVHTHTAKAGTLGRLAAILAGVPIKIHTFHGHVFDGYFSPQKAMIFLYIERFLALFTDKVIVVSESVRDDIITKLKVTEKRKSAVIPLGFELEKFLGCEKNRGHFRKTLGVEDDVLLVGIIGRLVPIKNHKMFLEAVKKVISITPRPKVKFIIVGDGELRSGLEDYAEAIGMKSDVIFAGWVSELSTVYVDLDVVALTSLSEGTPVSLIEAMASGRVVLATDVGGVRDLVIDNVSGVLAASGDSDGFSDKLIELLKDPARRQRLGMRGKADVKEKYSKDRLVKDMEKLYAECSAKKKTRK